MSERLLSLLVERTRVFVAERGRSLVMFGPAWERGGGRPPQPRDAVACPPHAHEFTGEVVCFVLQASLWLAPGGGRWG